MPAAKVRMTLKDGQATFSPKQPDVKKKEADARFWYYLGFLGEMGFGIAIPIVAGVLIGSFIDSRTGWYPKGTVSLLFLGLGISMMYLVSLVRMVR